MAIQVQDEKQIATDPALRAKIIEEIRGPENVGRKASAYKRHDCYKDHTNKYVVEKLVQQFDYDTVREMMYAVSNVSILRKVVDKLARVYSNGVKRNFTDDATTKQADEITKLLEINQKMKKVNRYKKLQRNVLAYVKPVKCLENGVELYEPKLEVLSPYLYDVIEDPNDREQMLCVILSHYEVNTPMSAGLIDPARAGRTLTTPIQTIGKGDGIDQTIADTPGDEDAQKKQYIWWTNSYHFTTNGKGEIIQMPGADPSTLNQNPIKELPFVNFSGDQDGSFWAEGGDDLVDGAILINSMISNLNHIGVTQGYGQFFMKGKNLPRSMKLGPNKAVLMEYSDGDPVPDVGFLTANPPLTELREVIEMYVALFLTTNNLTTSGVSASLNGSGGGAASGIALVIDKAESTEDVTDQAQVFLDNEPKLWKKIALWLNLYKGKNLLTERFRDKSLPEDVAPSLKFGDAKPIMSEGEKLEDIKARQEIGLNTDLELLMIDDPDLTEEDAKKRLAEIRAEKKVKLEEEMLKQSTALIKPGETKKVGQPADVVDA